MRALGLSLIAFLVLSAPGMQAQYLKKHNASLSVGGTGQFSTVFSSNATDVNTTAPFGPAGTYAVTVTQQHHATTNSAGALASFQLHPASWAGIEVNYGFTHYQERFGFYYSNTATPAALQQVRVPTDAHEATAAYLIHVRRLPFQPFMSIGGGAIDFDPRYLRAPNQWRGAGLAEVGFDLPVRWTHIGFRVEGRALFYRSPNFYNSAISNRSWRATSEPALSAFYRF